MLAKIGFSFCVALAAIGIIMILDKIDKIRGKEKAII